MLKKLSLKNFTAFRQVNLEFSNGLNVIVGENGSGKTHLLKLGYLLSNIWDAQVKSRQGLSKEAIERYISERLQNIFKPDKIGNLCRNGSDGKSVVSGLVIGSIPTVSITMPGETVLPSLGDNIEWGFRFTDRSETKAIVDDLPKRLTTNAVYGRSVFLPSKEMVSFFEGFLPLYETHELQFDETFRDLALRLSIPKLKEPPQMIGDLLAELSTAIGGEIVLEGGRFYIKSHGSKKQLEITLLAEGLRKLATILQLIENGSLKAGGTLFWDEPEANLNPRLIRLVAKALINLSINGIQVIVATHSLFLLRELEIQSTKMGLEEGGHKYFALKLSDKGVLVKQGESVDDIDPLILLDESLLQSERFIEQG